MTSKIYMPSPNWRETARYAQSEVERLTIALDAERRKNEELRVALVEIRDMDWVEACLDPQWARRRAAHALRGDASC